MRALQILVAINISISILMGAVASHWLQNSESITLLQKASFYHLTQCLGIFLILQIHQCLKLSSLILFLGVLLFCGSLYLKAFLIIESAILAPWGGSLMILAWLVFAVELIFRNRKPS